MRIIAKNVNGMAHMVSAPMQNILKIHIMWSAYGDTADTERRRDEV